MLSQLDFSIEILGEVDPLPSVKSVRFPSTIESITKSFGEEARVDPLLSSSQATAVLGECPGRAADGACKDDNRLLYLAFRLMPLTPSNVRWGKNFVKGMRRNAKYKSL